MTHTITTTTTAFTSTATAHGVVAVVVVITVIHVLLDINQPGAMRYLDRYDTLSQIAPGAKRGTKMTVKKER